MKALTPLVEINDLIGKPWRLGARGPDAFDCWGLVREVLLRLRPGEPLPDWASDHMTRERQRQLMGSEAPVYGVPTRDLDTGVVLLSERRAHIAIVVDGWAITARRGSGVVAMRTWDYAQHFGDLRAYTWRT